MGARMGLGDCLVGLLLVWSVRWYVLGESFACCLKHTHTSFWHVENATVRSFGQAKKRDGSELFMLKNTTVLERCHVCCYIIFLNTCT